MSHPKELEGGGGLWTSQHVPVLLLHSSRPTGRWRRGSSTSSPHQQPPGTPGCCRQGRPGQLTTGMVGQGHGRFAHGAAGKTSKTPYRGAGNASESRGHEGQPSQGGRYGVYIGLSWPHGCLVVMILSSSSYKGCNHCGRSSGGVGSWSGLLLSQGRRWLNLGTVFVPWSSGASLGITVCGDSGEVLCDQRNPGPNVALGRSRDRATGYHQHPHPIITPVGEGGLSWDRAVG